MGVVLEGSKDVSQVICFYRLVGKVLELGILPTTLHTSAGSSVMLSALAPSCPSTNVKNLADKDISTDGSCESGLDRGMETFCVTSWEISSNASPRKSPDGSEKILHGKEKFLLHGSFDVDRRVPAMFGTNILTFGAPESVAGFLRVSRMP